MLHKAYSERFHEDLIAEMKNTRDRHDADTTSRSSMSENDSSLDLDREIDFNCYKAFIVNREYKHIPEEKHRLESLVGRMIEDPSVNWLQGMCDDITVQGKYLLSIVADSMVNPGECICPSPELGGDAFVLALKKLLGFKTIKRKDQKLRMVYGALLKMLFKLSPKKKSRNPRLLSFIDKYGKDDRTRLQAAVNSCRFPSKKRLLIFFVTFPEVFSDARNLVENGDCLATCLMKQRRRIEGIVESFIITWQKSPGIDLHLRKGMKENLAHMPWSSEELISSISLLKKIFDEVAAILKTQKDGGLADNKALDFSQLTARSRKNINLVSKSL